MLPPQLMNPFLSLLSRCLAQQKQQQQTWWVDPGLSGGDLQRGMECWPSIHLHQWRSICLTWDVIVFSLPHTCSFLWTMLSHPPSPPLDSHWSIAESWKNMQPAGAALFRIFFTFSDIFPRDQSVFWVIQWSQEMTFQTLTAPVPLCCWLLWKSASGGWGYVGLVG